MGANDSAYGVRPYSTRLATIYANYIPISAPSSICTSNTLHLTFPSNPIQLETYYNLSYTIVSLVFLSPLLGYATAAIVNERAHCAIGRRGVAFVSSSCHLIAYILNCVHPPYPVLVVSFIFAGLGNGLADSAWNAWIGNLHNANQLLGLLHGFYGVGAVVSPLVASLLVADAGLPWFYFYYIMVCIFFFFLHLLYVSF
jgi:fucose permease